MAQQAPRIGCIFKSAGLALSSTAGILLALVAILFIGEIVLWAVGGLLIVSDPLDKKTDGAVVLSGGSGRIEEAASIYNEKLTNMIILTETGEELPEYGKFSAIQELALMDMGIPSGAILITERHVNTTSDEARAARKLAQQQGMKSLTIITDPFHCLRTRLIFRDEFRGSGVEIYIHPVQNHWYRSSTWWLSARGRETTLNEYGALFRDLLKINLR